MNESNGSSKRNQKRKISSRQRPVDFLAEDISSWWGKTFVFIKKTRVKTWKGVFVLAFSAGAAAAIVWTVSMNIQTSSKAASASLELFADTEPEFLILNGNNTFDMDILLNSQDNNVVAVKAVVNYNPQDFRLQSFSTSNSVFAANNACVYNEKPCEIIDNDPANGKITITVAKPSPGVNVESGIVGQLTFQALRVVSPPSSPNFTLSYSPGSYDDDSDVIYDDGVGTDILTEVTTNGKVAVYSSICTDFSYSDWSECINGEQSREIINELPEGCIGGSTADLFKDCEGPPSCVYSYTEWGDCVSGKQSRTVISSSPDGCVGTPELEKSCGAAEPCVSFSYSGWGDCSSKGIQTRTVKSSSPTGCNGGAQPIVERSCKKEKKDKEKPKFTDLPLFLNKSRGEMIWWKAKDNEGIDHYRYYFNGGDTKTKKRHFFIPVTTRPGVYVLRVRAYDEAGNTKSRYVTLRVR